MEHWVVDKYARIRMVPSSEIVVWETASKSVRARFDKTKAWINSVACSPDGRYLATGLSDSTILIWRTP
jgi:WD40 repeat protein